METQRAVFARWERAAARFSELGAGGGGDQMPARPDGANLDGAVALHTGHDGAPVAVAAEVGRNELVQAVAGGDGVPPVQVDEHLPGGGQAHDVGAVKGNENVAPLVPSGRVMPDLVSAPTKKGVDCGEGGSGESCHV